MGSQPLMLDNNGGEDIEIIVLLTDRCPRRRSRSSSSDSSATSRPADWSKPPRSCPIQADIAGDVCRKGWRVFGVDESYRYCTRVWNERWLEREEAIEAILARMGDSPELLANS